ncbi:tyrosine-type recombinase/integrase [Blautia massiliensis (ex Durand et al. 2017)]|uniref:tyrosine-type recombinase/integrase n=1 Tax=Blautia massiliensis (ex Durand et al. 2017) TaxID=1737424 RepID=UPI00241CC7BE|nr:site-specific integrase [Blautia massiliensis (ex Durand et al. 2017)]MBN2958001.1 site-specific integrase [Blautia massiliensis (ex Durand et al. 2017)]
MADTTKSGVYQLENGMWGFRYTVTYNGKRKDVKRQKDELGRILKTEKAALRARESAMLHDKMNRIKKPVEKRMTFAEVYQEYCEMGRSGKAYATIKKQDSLWKNHLAEKFGNKFIDEISVAEVNDYLSQLYYTEGRAYKYVESFLKMFYLIFGQAYSRNYLDVDTYNKLCVMKEVRISMPKMKNDEDTDIVAYEREQVKALEEYFTGTNAETAYLLGCYCGLRINECYGLKWKNVDLEHGTITIDRQMQYQEGLIKLVPLKTRNACRTVYMSEKLKAYFVELARQRVADAEQLKGQREQNQTFIEDLDGEKVSSLELVNSLSNGKIQTVNSMKYHSRTIKTKLGIDFKFHHLRHTYGTRLAELNTPTHILCNQMGHASGKVTERYYLAVSQSGIDILVRNLNAI